MTDKRKDEYIETKLLTGEHLFISKKPLLNTITFPSIKGVLQKLS